MDDEVSDLNTFKT